MEIPLVAAISVAPGVNQANTTGTRDQTDNPALPMAFAAQIAKIQMVVWPGVASAAMAADSAGATVLLQPTSVATSAAEIMESRIPATCILA